MAISKIIYQASSSATPEVWMDATTATATASDIIAPKTAMLADGVMTTGTGSGGGGMTHVEESDVNFIDDYDGTTIYSYTAAEFANLSELPSNPSHAGLTAQGWNWTLSDAKTYVATYGKLWIGQSYITISGNTEIDIDLVAPRLSPYLIFVVNGTAEVDWGDNSAHDTVIGTSLTTMQRIIHNYATEGRYTIQIKVLSGQASIYAVSPYSVLSGNLGTSADRVYSNAVIAVRFGNSMGIGQYAFNNCSNLKYVTLPQNIVATSITYAFANCYSLASITFPKSITNINNYAFQYCYGLRSVSLPKEVTTIGTYVFRNCTALRFLTIPNSVTALGNYDFHYCYNLNYVIIPTTVTAMGTYTFQYCYSLVKTTIQSNVTTIGTSLFHSCYGLGEIHFKATNPPSVTNSNSWTNIPTDCVIYVPASTNHTVLDAYKAAANYPNPSTYTYMEE